MQTIGRLSALFCLTAPGSFKAYWGKDWTENQQITGASIVNLITSAKVKHVLASFTVSFMVTPPENAGRGKVCPRYEKLDAMACWILQPPIANSKFVDVEVICSCSGRVTVMWSEGYGSAGEQYFVFGC